MKSRAHALFTNVLVATASIYGLTLSMDSRIFGLDRILLLLGGAAGVGHVVQTHRRREAKLSEYLPAVDEGFGEWRNGLAHLIAELGEGTDMVTPDAIKVSRPAQTVASIIYQATRDAESELTAFMTDDFWRGSKVIAGARGSGKSVLLTADCTHWFRVNEGNDPQLIIVDGHNRIRLPGIPEPAMQEMIAVNDRDADIAIRSFMDELQKRIDGKVPESEWYPMKLVIDEATARLRKMSPDQAERLVDMFEDTLYEGRKFKAEVVLCLHGLKKGQTGIDLGALLNTTWVLTGTAILDDPTVILPPSLSEDRKQWLAERDRLADMVPNGKYRSVIVKPSDGKPFAGLLPNWEKGQIDVEVEWEDPISEWWDRVEDLVFERFQLGDSPTATCEWLNDNTEMDSKIKRSPNDGRWVLLKDKYDDYKQHKLEENNDA